MASQDWRGCVPWSPDGRTGRGAGCRLGWVQTPGGNILRESGDLSLQTP